MGKGMGVNVNDLVLVQGMADTKLALREWNSNPWKALRPWLALSFAIACTLLFAVWFVAELSSSDPTPYILPGVNAPARWIDYGHVLYRNSLVLALHAMACVAGFMAGSSLPLSAERRTGLSRWVHEKAGPLAIGFVICATTFSLCTQAYVIGASAASFAYQLDLSPAVLLIGLAPHALPELMALFLPLAAWIIASRRDDWHVLLAATFVTVAIAVPTLLASATIEIWVSPHILLALSGS
jgi:hypothetical protein